MTIDIDPTNAEDLTDSIAQDLSAGEANCQHYETIDIMADLRKLEKLGF